MHFYLKCYPLLNWLCIRPTFISVLILIVIISCDKKNDASNKKTIVQKESSSDLYNSEWVKGKTLFLENCGACHLTVKKDEVFAKYMISIETLSIDQRAQDIKRILAGEKHLAIQDDIFNSEELKAISKFIVTPQKSGVVH